MEAVEKPPQGAPCNRCGWCCASALCHLARSLFTPTRWADQVVPGPCPVLERDADNRHVCGLTVRPSSYFPLRAKHRGEDTLRQAAQVLIGTGIGCDSVTDDEPDNPEFDRRLSLIRREKADAIRMAAEVWGIQRSGV